MTEQNNSERRRYPRVNYNIPLKLSSSDADFVTETNNVSCSGAYCRVDQYIEPMTKLEIQLLLPIKKGDKVSNVKVNCGGVVVRTESVPNEGCFDTAIFFNDIGQKDLAVLSEFVDTVIQHSAD